MGFLNARRVNRRNCKHTVSQFLEFASSSGEAYCSCPQALCLFNPAEDIGRIAAGADADDYITLPDQCFQLARESMAVKVEVFVVRAIAGRGALSR